MIEIVPHGNMKSNVNINLKSKVYNLMLLNVSISGLQEIHVLIKGLNNLKSLWIDASA